ncbi:5251_t:CDS:2, partial [Dentiscutata heterogama]
ANLILPIIEPSIQEKQPDQNKLQSDKLQDNIQDELQVYIQDELQINIEDKLQTDYITTEDDWNERLAKCLQTHPTININAKWNLCDLFIRELEKPDFISISLN